MWGASAPLHARTIVSQIQLGLPDCLLVSTQCGGQVSSHSLLLALHSPLLAGLLQEAAGRSKGAGLLSQGAVGLTLPLPLNTIKGLVALLNGEAGEVAEEVKEAVVFLGMGVNEECGLVTGATHEEELLSYWEDDPENIVKSKEGTKCSDKSLDNSEFGQEQNVSEKTKEASSNESFRLKEGSCSLVSVVTFEEELSSKTETTHNSLEHTKCEDEGEYHQLENKKVKCNSEEYVGSWQSEDTKQKQTNSVKPRKKESNGKTLTNESKPSQNQVICIVCSKTFTNKYFLKKTYKGFP